jgi:hypothetical protein
MTAKTRLTFNKRLILEALTVNMDSPPPHSANTVFYILETAFDLKWSGIYEGMKTKPNVNQIRRTLRSLANEGLIVCNRTKQQWFDSSSCKLPYWELEWQLSGDVYRNALITECQTVYKKVDKAKNGAALFTSVFDMGLPANEVKPLMNRVKALMQKTHPDKANGYEHEFKQMKQCATWIRSGIPLPTPTHTAGDKVKITLTFPK